MAAPKHQQSELPKTRACRVYDWGKNFVYDNVDKFAEKVGMDSTQKNAFVGTIGGAWGTSAEAKDGAPMAVFVTSRSTSRYNKSGWHLYLVTEEFAQNAFGSRESFDLGILEKRAVPKAQLPAQQANPQPKRERKRIPIKKPG